MAKLYTPRKAGARWLAEAPPYVLDCFDSGAVGERYTVLFRFPEEDRRPYAKTWVQFLGMSGAPTHPQGVSMWGEFEAYQAAGYRYREGHHRVKWLDLPENIRKHVVARATALD